jgi:hypothetical protein
LTPYTIRIVIENSLMASDNGKGIITGADINGDAITGTVNYATGVGSITLAGTAPAANTVTAMSGSIALENDNDLQITQNVDLSLRACPFIDRVKGLPPDYTLPFPGYNPAFPDYNGKPAVLV